MSTPTSDPTTLDVMLWCFDYFYQQDKANACIHCAPVRFSPVTFRLVEVLLAEWPPDEDITDEMAQVRDHIGKYPEDRGR